MSGEARRKPPHRRFRLDPPHGDRIYWVAEGQIPGDSRAEHVSVVRSWFWRESGQGDE